MRDALSASSGKPATSWPELAHGNRDIFQRGKILQKKVELKHKAEQRGARRAERIVGQAGDILARVGAWES